MGPSPTPCSSPSAQAARRGCLPLRLHHAVHQRPGDLLLERRALRCAAEPACDVTDEEVRSFTVAPPVVGGPPNTRLTRHPGHRTHRRKVTFRFSSSLPGASFECFYTGGWTPCESPQRFRHLKPGRYRFKVRAVANGQRDPTPAKFLFKVVRRHRRHRAGVVGTAGQGEREEAGSALRSRARLTSARATASLAARRTSRRPPQATARLRPRGGPRPAFRHARAGPAPARTGSGARGSRRPPVEAASRPAAGRHARRQKARKAVGLGAHRGGRAARRQILDVADQLDELGLVVQSPRRETSFRVRVCLREPGSSPRTTGRASSSASSGSPSACTAIAFAVAQLERTCDQCSPDQGRSRPSSSSSEALSARATFIRAIPTSASLR